MEFEPGILITTNDITCPFCNSGSKTQSYFLEESDNFSIAADGHPLLEGHILIIPKDHISCIGEYPKELFAEFESIYEKVRKFVKDEYGALSVFEHGKLGQSVFHSHTHILPFGGNPEEIIPEGVEKIQLIKGVSELRDLFRSDGRYLFFSIENQSWVVDTSLGFPRFFRDKFASAIGRLERGNWKEMHENQNLMVVANRENNNLANKWREYFRK